MNVKIFQDSIKKTRGIDKRWIPLSLFLCSLYILGILKLVLLMSAFTLPLTWRLESSIIKRHHNWKYNTKKEEVPDFLKSRTNIDISLSDMNNIEALMFYQSCVDKIIIPKDTLEKDIEEKKLISLLKHEEGHSKYHKKKRIYYYLLVYSVIALLIGVLSFIDKGVFPIFAIFGIIFISSCLYNYLGNLSEKKADLNSVEEDYGKELKNFYQLEEKEKAPYWTLFLNNYPTVNQRKIWLEKHI